MLRQILEPTNLIILTQVVRSTTTTIIRLKQNRTQVELSNATAKDTISTGENFRKLVKSCGKPT